MDTRSSYAKAVKDTDTPLLGVGDAVPQKPDKTNSSRCWVPRSYGCPALALDTYCEQKCSSSLHANSGERQASFPFRTPCCGLPDVAPRCTMTVSQT